MVSHTKDWNEKPLSYSGKRHSLVMKKALDSLITGGTPSTAVSQYWDGDIPWLSSTEIHQKQISQPTRFITQIGLMNSSAALAPANSVLVALAGQGKTRGTVAELTKPMALNQSLAALVPNKEVLDSRFLFYVMETKYEELRELSSGDGGRGGLNKTLLSNLNLTVPESIAEQRAIAGVLSGFDEHLANLDELIAKKKNIRDGALNDLITGDTRLSDSRDPWVQINFGDSVTPKARIGWQGLKAEEYLPMGYSYLIGGTDFYSGTISLESISFVDRERFELDPFIQVESGDVLVTKDGTIGKVALVPELDKPATLNSGVFVFRPNEKLRRDYLYWVLASSVFTDFIEALSAGSTIKHLYQKDLKEFSFKIPSSLTEQRMIAEALFSMDQEIHALQAERSKVEWLKLGAMDDLLTGRVRLPVEEVDA